MVCCCTTRSTRITNFTSTMYFMIQLIFYFHQHITWILADNRIQKVSFNTYFQRSDIQHRKQMWNMSLKHVMEYSNVKLYLMYNLPKSIDNISDVYIVQITWLIHFVDLKYNYKNYTIPWYLDAFHSSWYNTYLYIVKYISFVH